MTEHKLERIIHEESLPGALIEGYDRTLTYKVDNNGKLKCYQFVTGGCCLNREREVNNPLFDDVIGSAIPLALCSLLGAGAYLASDRNVEVGLAVGSILYLLTLPLGRQISADTAADKRAWKKYQKRLRAVS